MGSYGVMGVIGLGNWPLVLHVHTIPGVHLWQGNVNPSSNDSAHKPA